MTATPVQHLTKPQTSRHLTLFLILAFAVLLRAYGLDSESIWLDEGFTLEATSQSSIIKAATMDSTAYPLYYAGMWAWTRAAGTSEIALRLPSLAFSVVAILLTYALGMRLFNRKAALIAAAIMALSPYQIYHAQEARMYPLLMTFWLASTLAMDYALRGSRRFFPWACYVIFATLAVYVHVYTFFFIAAQNLFFFVRWRENRAKISAWLASGALVFVASCPVIANVLKHAGYQQARRHMLLKLPQAFYSLLIGETLVPMDENAIQNIRATLSAYWPLLVLVAVAFVLILPAIFAAMRRDRRNLALLLSLVLATALVSFGACYKSQAFDERYLLGLTPLMFLMLARGILYAFESRGLIRAAGAASVIGISIVFSIGLGNHYWNPRYGKEQWRDVVRKIEAHTAPDDIIVLNPKYLRVCFDYYLTRHDLPIVYVREKMASSDDPDWQAALGEIKSRRRVWMVESHNSLANVHRDVRAEFPRVKHEHFAKAKGINLYILER